MVVNGPSRTLSFLLRMFPEFEGKLNQIYEKDPVFREIAKEYQECIEKKEMIFNETGKSPDLYTDTISELKDELLSYLSK